MATLTTGISYPTEQLKKEFLEKFLELGRISATCRALKMNHRTFYHWKEQDPEFLHHFQLATQMLVDKLEDEAYRRAVEGVDVPIFHRGEQVGEIKQYSDALLITLLKANAPHKYNRESSRIPVGAGDGAGETSKLVHVHSEAPLANSEEEVIRQIEQDNNITDIPFDEVDEKTKD